MGNVTEVKENGRITARYFYDAIGRLVREDNKPMGKTAAFTYDNNGNITAKRIYAFTLCSAEELEERECEEIAYTYSGDRLLSYGNECCIYDENGNPTVYRDKYLTWEYGKRLSMYNATFYTYNGLGQLALLNGEPFTYDSAGRLIQRGDTLRFLYAGNERIGLRYGGVEYFYRKDALGNIISILDNSGAVVVKYVYDAWGNHKVLNPNGTENTAYDFIGNVNPFRYRGYYFDTTTGLYYLHSRFYDPVTGRFLSPDSVEYIDPETINGLNLYAYCGNNPIAFVDPSGRFPWLVVIIIAAAIIVTCAAAGGVSAGLSGGGIKDVWASIGKGAAIGAMLVGSIALTIGSFYVPGGATGTLGVSMWSYGINTSLELFEVGIIQGKKSYIEGDGFWTSMNDVINAVFANSGKIYGQNLLSKTWTAWGFYNEYNYFKNYYGHSSALKISGIDFGSKKTIFGAIFSGVVVTVNTALLFKTIFEEIDFESVSWVLY